MKLLRQTLLMAFLGLGFALTASAQEQPDKKKPPKNNAEIKPEDKKPPKNNDNENNDRRNNDKKKPQIFFLISQNRIEVSST